MDDYTNIYGKLSDFFCIVDNTKSLASAGLAQAHPNNYYDGVSKWTSDSQC